MENDYSNSDIVEEEYNKKVTEHSPLPHFDQICRKYKYNAPKHWIP